MQCKAPTGPVFPVRPTNRIVTSINRCRIAEGEMRLYLTCNCICFFGGIVVTVQCCAPEVEVLPKTLVSAASGNGGVAHHLIIM